MSGTETRLHVRLIAAADSALVPDMQGWLSGRSLTFWSQPIIWLIRIDG